MRTATVTYHAPKGDNEVVHMGGARFIDGEATEINSEEHPHLMSKIGNNHHFDVEMGEEQADDRTDRKRPQTRDLKAGIEEARDHDFEKDRRDNERRRAQVGQKGQGTDNALGFTGTTPKPKPEAKNDDK